MQQQAIRQKSVQLDEIESHFVCNGMKRSIQWILIGTVGAAAVLQLQKAVCRKKEWKAR